MKALAVRRIFGHHFGRTVSVSAFCAGCTCPCYSITEVPREQTRQRMNDAEFQRYETCVSPDRNPIKLRTDGFYLAQGRNEARDPKVFRFYEDGEIWGFLGTDYVGEPLACECFARGIPRPKNEPVYAVVRGRYCIDGAHVSFSLTGTYGGQREPVMYRGTVADDGTSISGASDYALDLVLKFKTFEQAGCSALSSTAVPVTQ